MKVNSSNTAYCARTAQANQIRVGCWLNSASSLRRVSGTLPGGTVNFIVAVHYHARAL